MRHRMIMTVILIIFAALGLAACDGDNEKTPEELPAPRPLLQESADKIQDATSFEVEMDVEGYPVEIDVDKLDAVPADVPLQFKYAKGVFQAPDRLEATFQVSLGVVSTTADLVALGREHYLRGDMLTGNQWINTEVIRGFSPASLLARPGGIAYALMSITDLEIVGEEDVDGLKVFHLRGTIQADAVNALTFGLIRSKHGNLKIEVYIDVSERRVSQIKLEEPPPADVMDADETTWRINILDYNQDVTITPPPVGEEE